jgi:signal peptidase I
MLRVTRLIALLAATTVLVGCGVTRNDTERYVMRTDAMAPTIPQDRTVTAKQVDAGDYTPHRGDIVVFRKPSGWSTADAVGIKRVVGIPGDTLACCDVAGRVTLNGQPLDEPYVRDNSPLEAPLQRDCRSRRLEPVVVPADQLFLMGDNRLVSQDSRCLGTVPSDAVIGIVTLDS